MAECPAQLGAPWGERAGHRFAKVGGVRRPSGARASSHAWHSSCYPRSMCGVQDAAFWRGPKGGTNIMLIFAIKNGIFGPAARWAYFVAVLCFASASLTAMNGPPGVGRMPSASGGTIG